MSISSERWKMSLYDRDQIEVSRPNVKRPNLQPDPVALVMVPDHDETGVQRARAIAAAPEMMEILESMITQLSDPLCDGGIAHSTLNRAIAVVNQIKGVKTNHAIQ